MTAWPVTCPRCNSRSCRHRIVITRRAATDDASVRRHCCAVCGWRWDTLQADPVNLPGGAVRWPQRGPARVEPGPP